MENFYEEKIEIVFNKFYDLFAMMLENKKCNKDDDFIKSAELVKKYYPNISQKIDRVVFYYLEGNESDEKLDYLMSLYKVIKENIYE